MMNIVDKNLLESNGFTVHDHDHDDHECDHVHLDHQK